MAFDFKKQEDRYLALIASILYLMWLADVIVKLLTGKILGLYLFCSLSLIIASIAIINRCPTILLLFLSANTIIQGMWMIDLLAFVFLQKSVFQATSYIFLENFSKIEVLSTMRHFFIIPLEFFALVFMKKMPKRFGLFVFYSSLFVLGFLVPSLFFGSRQNINYVYAPPFEVSGIFSNVFVYFFCYLLFLIVSSSLVGALYYLMIKKCKSLFKSENIKVYFWIVLVAILLLAIKVCVVILKLRY